MLIHRLTKWFFHVVFVALFACGSTVGQSLSFSDKLPIELVDGPGRPTFTHYNRIHVCPEGYALHGVDIDTRLFVCRRTQEAATDYFIDYGTRRSGRRACPTGTYIRGLVEHSVIDRSTLLVCAFDRRRGYTEFEGYAFADRCPRSRGECSQQDGIHVCRPGSVMTAYRGENDYVCREVRDDADRGTASNVTDLDPGGVRSYQSLSGRINIGEWQRLTRNWLSRIMDIPPGPPPKSVEFTPMLPKGETTDGVRQEHVKYPSPIDGAMIEAWISYPPDYDPQKKYPAVFVTHGHLEEVPDIADPSHFGSADHAIAFKLAKAGAITLAAEVRGFGWFEVPGKHGAYASNLPPGKYPQFYIGDNRMNVSQMLSIPGVDPNQTAVVGLSLGGFQSLWLGALDERIRKVVVAGIFLAQDCINNPNRHHGCQTVPAIKNRVDGTPLIDTEDLAALIAPRSLLITWGTSDLFYKYNPNKTCRINARDKTEELFRKLDIADHFAAFEFDGGHEIDEFDTVNWVLNSPFY